MTTIKHRHGKRKYFHSLAIYINNFPPIFLLYSSIPPFSKNQTIYPLYYLNNSGTYATRTGFFL